LNDRRLHLRSATVIVGCINCSVRTLRHFLSLFLHRVWYLLIHCFPPLALAANVGPSA
jgi:hypothetical protein